MVNDPSPPEAPVLYSLTGYNALAAPKDAADPATLEDRQVFRFLTALSEKYEYDGLEYSRDYDEESPEEKFITMEGERRGFATATYSVTDVIPELHRLRRLEALLQSLINQGMNGKYPHLEGTAVTLTNVTPAALPDDEESLATIASRLGETLKEDVGVVEENGLEADGSVEDDEPLTRGFHEATEGIIMHVYSMEDAGCTVASLVEEEVLSTQVEADFKTFVEAQDDAGAEVLLVTTSMVDGDGYRHPLDENVFVMLGNSDFTPEGMKHILVVFVHDYVRGDVLVFQAGE